MHDNQRLVYSYVKKQIAALSGNSNTVTQKLAVLRRGIGHSPDEVLDCWGLIFQNAPEEWLLRKGEPTKEEWAVFTALTLFAWSSQGKGRGNANVDNCSIGEALGKLAGLGENRKNDNIVRQFNILISSVDIFAMSVRLRRICNLLKQEGIGLDYALLAENLFFWQNENVRSKTVINWGRDFYRFLRNTIGGKENEE